MIDDQVGEVAPVVAGQDFVELRLGFHGVLGVSESEFQRDAAHVGVDHDAG